MCADATVAPAKYTLVKEFHAVYSANLVEALHSHLSLRL